MARLFVAWMVAAGLAACGGGGSGGGNDWLTFAPGTLSVTTQEGESTALGVVATSSRTISGVIQLGIIDDVGVLDPQATSIVADSPTRYNVTLGVSSLLSVGTHTGQLEVRLCRDDPRTCASPIDGSPWKLPYTITVRSNLNLTPLRPLAGAGSWQTFQGSAQHNGYVPADLDPASFSRRFLHVPPGHDGRNDVAVDNGVAVLATGDTFATWWMQGISESTGLPVWTTSMGPLNNVNAPAMADGKVYATSTGHQNTQFWTFSATDGTRLNQQPMNTRSASNLAPTVAGGAVYTHTGSDGGLARFNAQTDMNDWTIPVPSYGGWTPAIDGTLAYGLVQDRLFAWNVSDGAQVFTITDPDYQQDGNTMCAAPVLVGGAVYASNLGSSNARVMRFDTQARAVAWSTGTAVKSQPVVVGETVYVLDGNELHARSAQTGALLWSWTSPAEFGSGIGVTDGVYYPVSLVVVGRHAFFSTTAGTIALDLTTRQIAWRDTAAGRLAVSSNGVLYISGRTALVAVNLH